MKQSRILSRAAGFSVVELIIATALVATLSVVTYATFASSRVSSRDARRRTDVQVLMDAVNQYQQANGNGFIQDVNPTTKAKLACAVSAQADPTVLATPTDGTGGCVGALGRAYGKVNLKSASQNWGSASPLTDSYGSVSTYQHGSRKYSNISIVDALIHGGYLINVPRDPLSAKLSTSDGTARDYVLIRACRNGGKQSIGTNGSIFAVWAYMEGNVASADLDRSAKYPGGTNVVPNTAAGDVYQYDFASMQAEFNKGAYTAHGYAVGSGGAQTYSDASDCAGNPTEGENA